MPSQPLEGGVCIYVHSPGKGCAKRPENDRLQLQHVHNSSSHAGKRGAGCPHAGTLLQGELLCVHAPRRLAVDVAGRAGQAACPAVGL